MERNFELSINISEEIAEKLGIDESTVFDTYYEDGRLIIAAVDEDEYYDEDEEYYDDEDDFSEEDNECDLGAFVNCNEEECDDCDFCCPHCGECIINKREEE